MPYADRKVALFTRAWIEIKLFGLSFADACVALFTRAWIEMYHIVDENTIREVALFTRAWIEILNRDIVIKHFAVALFTRAWIEMTLTLALRMKQKVALFTRAWIEIIWKEKKDNPNESPSSRGRGLKYSGRRLCAEFAGVAHSRRAWIERVCWCSAGWV